MLGDKNIDTKIRTYDVEDILLTVEWQIDNIYLCYACTKNKYKTKW